MAFFNLSPPLILALCCLSAGMLQTHVWALDTVPCQEQDFEAGSIITHQALSWELYCGSKTRYFYALKKNVLFTLHCGMEESNPSTATPKIIQLNDLTTRRHTFNRNAMCEIISPGLSARPTGDNAFKVAMKMTQSPLPYNKEGCNAHHYVEYLAFGKTRTNRPRPPNSSCPVFSAFDRWTDVDSPGFQLRGQTEDNFRSRSTSWNSSASATPLGKKIGSSSLSVSQKKSRSGGSSSGDNDYGIPSTPKPRKRHRNHNETDEESSASRNLPLGSLKGLLSGSMGIFGSRRDRK